MNISLPLPCTILFCFGASLFFALTPWIAKVIRRKFSSTSEAKYPDSEIIKQNYRCIIATIVTILLVVSVLYISHIQNGFFEISACISWFGFNITIDTPINIFKIFILNSVLFAGSIFQFLLTRKTPKHKQLGIFLFKCFFLAPLLEEVIYRCIFIGLFLGSGLSNTYAIFIAPLFFLISHLRRAIKRKNMKSVKMLLVKCFFGLLSSWYTYIFGVYAGYIWIQYGSFYVIWMMHAYCNYLTAPTIFIPQTHKYFKCTMYLYLIGLLSFTLLIIFLHSYEQ